jgi:hypothetical protein
VGRREKGRGNSTAQHTQHGEGTVGAMERAGRAAADWCLGLALRYGSDGGRGHDGQVSRHHVLAGAVLRCRDARIHSAPSKMDRLFTLANHRYAIIPFFDPALPSLRSCCLPSPANNLEMHRVEKNSSPLAEIFRSPALRRCSRASDKFGNERDADDKRVPTAGYCCGYGCHRN